MMPRRCRGAVAVNARRALGPMSAAVERTTLLAGGTRTRLVQAGPADATEAVVFVHGNPGSADDWERLAGAAAGAAGQRAVAFDLPDFGETIAPDGFAHDVPGYAAFVAEALEELGIERVAPRHPRLRRADRAGLGDDARRRARQHHPDRHRRPARLHAGTAWRGSGARRSLGELFQATATRRVFRFMINRNEPRGLPREFVETMYDHYDRRTRRAVLKLYRATPDPGRRCRRT